MFVFASRGLLIPTGGRHAGNAGHQPPPANPLLQNPRQGNTDAIAQSLAKNGQYRAVVVNIGTHTGRPYEILAGNHTYKAATQLGWETITCHLVDVDEDGATRIVLADNQTSDLATNSDDTLVSLLQSLDGELTGTGFTDNDLAALLAQDQQQQPKGDHSAEQARTGDAYNLHLYQPTRTSGRYNMPTLEPVDYTPKALTGFNYARTKADKADTIHFFLDDYQFERVWSAPEVNGELLLNFEAVLTPDFSLYTNMPNAMKIWNIYRSRLLGQFWQYNGMTVIPTVSWSTPDSFTFAFDGLPANSTLAISTIGVHQNERAREIWNAGVDELITRLNPKRLIIYGKPIDRNYGNAELAHFANKNMQF